VVINLNYEYNNLGEIQCIWVKEGKGLKVHIIF
jgi:hypothetical protein